MSKVLLLDIDGVLIPTSKLSQPEEELYYIPENEERNRYHNFDPSCVARLNEITETTGAKIVVSSVWRLKTYIREILDEQGIEGEVIGATPTKTRADVRIRGNLIGEWLRNNEVDEFVILDDDSDMGEYMDHLVQCDHMEGLTEEIKEEVIERLS